MSKRIHRGNDFREFLKQQGMLDEVELLALKRAIELQLERLRKARPVAKLVRVSQTQSRPKRWDPQAHLRWLKRTWRGKQLRLVDKYLQTDREA